MLLISYLLSSFSIDYTKLREVSVPQQVLVLHCLDDILNTNHHVPPVLRISTLILAKAKTDKFIKFENNISSLKPTVLLQTCSLFC